MSPHIGKFGFSDMPTFYMCTLKLPIHILDHIDSDRKHVLWHGGDVSKKKERLFSGMENNM